MSDYETLALALDPALLFKKAVGSDPDDWQAELLYAATTGDESKILALIGRQVGKSRVVSVVAAHHAIFSPGSLTVVGSGSLGQSQELGRQVFSAIRAVDPDGVKAENLTRVELRSGARVICLPASETVRDGLGLDSQAGHAIATPGAATAGFGAEIQAQLALRQVALQRLPIYCQFRL